MPKPHCRLTSGRLLSRLMRCPDQGGTRHTVRTLADAAGLSKSKIGDMLRDRQMCVSDQQADAIAEAVDIERDALFHANCVCVRKRRCPNHGSPQ